jgi:hypothetical protein
MPKTSTTASSAMNLGDVLNTKDPTMALKLSIHRIWNLALDIIKILWQKGVSVMLQLRPPPAMPTLALGSYYKKFLYL